MDEQPNYDFIMNPTKSRAPKSSSMKQRIIVVAVSAIILMVAVLIANALLSSGTKNASNSLIDLIAYQSELKRIITTGVEDSRSIEIQNKAVTASNVLETHLKDSQAMLRNRRVALPKDISSRYASPEIDKQLEDAKKANQFDSVYSAVYSEKLLNYQTKLRESFPALSAPEQEKLRGANESVKILLGQNQSNP